MTKAGDMMIMPTEKRRSIFRKLYVLELGRLHASGVCAWPIEQLSPMMDGIMDDLLLNRVAPRGPAFDAVKKFFGLKSNRAVFEFLGCADGA